MSQLPHNPIINPAFTVYIYTYTQSFRLKLKEHVDRKTCKSSAMDFSNGYLISHTVSNFSQGFSAVYDQ